jgi:hypothetical protein
MTSDSEKAVDTTQAHAIELLPAHLGAIGWFADTLLFHCRAPTRSGARAISHSISLFSITARMLTHTGPPMAPSMAQPTCSPKPMRTLNPGMRALRAGSRL